MTEHLQANRYERTEERRGYRNGSRSRHLTTRVGTVTLEVPRTRDGEFSPTLFDRYQRHEKALVLTLMEMVVNGVSTRKIRRITEELCGTAFSKSTVSDLAKGFDSAPQIWTFAISFTRIRIGTSYQPYGLGLGDRGQGVTSPLSPSAKVASFSTL